MSRSDRCPTSSGPFGCDRPAGHDGECVTRERSKPWVGPAHTAPALTRAVTRAEATQRASQRVDVVEDGSEVVRAEKHPKNITRTPIEGASHG